MSGDLAEGHGVAEVLELLDESFEAPMPDPFEAKISVEKNGEVEKAVVYIRSLNGTKELSDGERQKYVISRWPETGVPKV